MAVLQDSLNPPDPRSESGTRSSAEQHTNDIPLERLQRLNPTSVVVGSAHWLHASDLAQHWRIDVPHASPWPLELWRYQEGRWHRLDAQVWSAGAAGVAGASGTASAEAPGLQSWLLHVQPQASVELLLRSAHGGAAAWQQTPTQLWPQVGGLGLQAGTAQAALGPQAHAAHGPSVGLWLALGLLLGLGLCALALTPWLRQKSFKTLVCLLWVDALAIGALSSAAGHNAVAMAWLHGLAGGAGSAAAWGSGSGSVWQPQAALAVLGAVALWLGVALRALWHREGLVRALSAADSLESAPSPRWPRGLQALAMCCAAAAVLHSLLGAKPEAAAGLVWAALVQLGLSAAVAWQVLQSLLRSILHSTPRTAPGPSSGSGPHAGLLSCGVALLQGAGAVALWRLDWRSGDALALWIWLYAAVPAGLMLLHNLVPWAQGHHAQAQQLARLRERARLYAAAQHDLWQPLQSLQMYRQALTRASPTQQGPLLTRMDLALRSTHDFMQTLRHIWSDPEAEQAALIEQRLDLQALLDALVEEYRGTARLKHVQLRYRPPSLFVRSHAVQLERLVRNLLANAIRYTPTGGGVLVACRKRQGQWWLCVFDTGPGFPPEQAERCFEAFTRHDDSVEIPRSLGLGLYSVRQTARLLRLRTHLISRSGSGTQIGIALHVAPSTPA